MANICHVCRATLLVTYTLFAFFGITCLSLLDTIAARFIDHGLGWHGYRLSAYHRYREARRLGGEDVDVSNVGGRVPLFHSKGMKGLTRWMRDTELWKSDVKNPRGLNKTIIRGWPVRYRNKDSGVYKLLDLRRWLTQVAGVALVVVQVCLFVKDVSKQQIWRYIAQYEYVKQTWDNMNSFGPAAGWPTGCAYYDHSAVPIRIYLGASDRSSAYTK